jgi:hypothetical protein
MNTELAADLAGAHRGGAARFLSTRLGRAAAPVASVAFRSIFSFVGPLDLPMDVPTRPVQRAVRGAWPAASVPLTFSFCLERHGDCPVAKVAGVFS